VVDLVVFGLELDSMILKVFSNLKHSMILCLEVFKHQLDKTLSI